MRDLHQRAAFYHEQLLPRLTEMEAERNALRTQRTGLTVATFPLVLLILSGFGVGGPLGIIGGIVAIIVLGVLWANFSSRHDQFRGAYKSRVICPMVAALDPQLTYHPVGHIHEAYFRSSGLFQTAPDRYSGEDFVEGFCGTTRIAFSELHAEYETEDDDGDKSYHTIFKGFYFIATFNKRFRVKTLVLPDATTIKMARGIGALFNKMLQGTDARQQRVVLEDPEFERLFEVYSDDQIEARYLLSTTLMQRLVELRSAANGPLYVAFVEGSVHVAIPRNVNLWEPNINHPLTDPKFLEGHWSDLFGALGLVEALDLDNRIWGEMS